MSAPKAQRQAVVDQRRALVDEFAELERSLAAHKKYMARRDDLAKMIRGWATDALPHEGVTYSGERFSVRLGPRGMESRIRSMETVFKTLGRKTFLAWCSMTLSALMSAGGDVAALTVKEQTGSRSIAVCVIPKAP